MAQEGTFMKPCETGDTETCTRISRMLGRIGDKWTVLTVRSLGAGPARFSALKREMCSISQKMLTSTLRNLERDGLVSRTVHDTSPPQVEYELTELGAELGCLVASLAEWTWSNADRIEAAQAAYDGRQERPRMAG